MSIKVFCDVCNQELERNMVTEKLTIEPGVFKVEVAVTVNKDIPQPALCYDCLLKMLNTKLKRKYVRKQGEPEEPPKV